MRLRFTIRDLLWLTLVVAVAVGWWLNNRQLTAQLLAQHYRLKDLNKAHIELKDLNSAHIVPADSKSP